jgi:hypothetical protein
MQDSMKKIVVSVMLILGFFSVRAQKPGESTGAVIKFDHTHYDYGKIYFRSEGTHVFHFVNAGNEPLLLSKPRSSCGCTVPSWPKAPILPGDSGAIKITYNTHIMGEFNKSVTVFSNAGKPVVLHIHGMVIPRPKPLVPVKPTNDNATPVKK